MIGIIGGGVSGLSCGVLLRETGYPVTLWSRDPVAQTTSSVAAAIWHPFQVGGEGRVLPWAAATYDVLHELAADPHSGVVLQVGREFFHEPTPDPPWSGMVQDFRHLTSEELSPPYVDGFQFETIVAQTPVYLQYLQDRFIQSGGILVARTLTSLEEALGEVDVVVNCAGLGARELADDPTLYPIRGQVMRLAPLPGATFRFDEYGPRPITYIIPRADGIIVGGTVQPDNWDLVPDPATADRILAQAHELMPELAGLLVLEHKVGLRPGRPAVRLELENRSNGVVIHNYGHGGSGYTLSWGCAAEVLGLVQGVVSASALRVALS